MEDKEDKLELGTFLDLQPWKQAHKVKTRLIDICKGMIIPTESTQSTEYSMHILIATILAFQVKIVEVM